MSPGMSDDMNFAVKFLLEDRTYPEGCSENFKRTIRRQAVVLGIIDGEVSYFKGKKNAEGEKVKKKFFFTRLVDKQHQLDNFLFLCFIKVTQEVKYIQGSKERQGILKACYIGPT